MFQNILSKTADLIFPPNRFLDILDKLQQCHKREDTLETPVGSHYSQIDVKDLPALKPSSFERV